MSGHFFYYGPGGGGIPPKFWIGALVLVAVALGVGTLLLPVIGIVVLGSFILGAAGLAYRTIAAWLLGKRADGAAGRVVDGDASDGNPFGGDGSGPMRLEVRDAVVVEEIRRERRNPGDGGVSAK